MKTFLLFLACALPLSATTYYVDYVGGSDAAAGTSTGVPLKRAPGMVGYTGAPALSGNDFVFKGGTTWPSAVYPWTINASGNSGDRIEFKSDAAWYTGGSFAKPLFDAGGTEPSGGMIQGTSRSWLTFDGLDIANYGTAYTEDGKKAIDFANPSGITIKNCRLRTFSWITIYLHFDNAGTYSEFDILNNECTDTTGLLWFADGYQTGRNRSGLRVKGNWIHDFNTKIGWAGVVGDGTHSDGLLHAYGNSNVSGVEVANNLCNGSFTRGFGTSGGVTAWIFCEGDGSIEGTIYNNIIAPTSVPAYKLAECFIRLSGTGSSTWTVYNNLLLNTNASNPTMASAGIFATGPGTFTIKNNITVGLQYAVWADTSTATYVVDYNNSASTSGQLIYAGTGSPSFQTFAQWKSAGRDVNGTLTPSASFVGAPTDLRLAPTSTGYGTGTNLNSSFTVGLDPSATWPNPTLLTRGATWDYGPYAMSAGGGSAPSITATAIQAVTITISP